MSGAVDVDISHESQPIIVSPLESKVGKFLDNSPLRSLMNVNGNDDEGHKTKRRSLKSKTTETVKRKRRRLIHEFLSQSDTSDKYLTQNEATEMRESRGISSDKINNVELVSTTNGNEAGTSNSPIVINGSNDSSVFIVENGLIDDVIVISDSQSPNSSVILPNSCTTIEENVTSLDESVGSLLSDVHDENFDTSPEKSDAIRDSTDVSTNTISPSRHSKRKSDLTTETTNTSPSSVSHSRSFRIVRLACNDDDDVSWRYSREQNGRSSATNSTGSNPVNGSATPPPALMNDRTMKMLMVRSESSNSSATKSFKSHNNVSIEKKVKQPRQYVIKECTSPGILKNSNRNAAAPSPKTSKMVNFAANLTHTKFYRIGDALYDECNLDEENDDELGMTAALPDVLYPSLRNCKDSIDSIMSELNMNAVTVELFQRMGIESVGDLASIQMTENDIVEADCNLEKLRTTLKKYDDERRPTGLRTPQCKTTTFSKTIVELLEEIREAQNHDETCATENATECVRLSDTNVDIENSDFEKRSDIFTRTDDPSARDEEVSSSTEQIFDESSRLAIDEVATVTNCEPVESSSLAEENATANGQVTIDSVGQQQPPVGVENEESDFVCTNDEHCIDPCTVAKLSEVSRSVPSLPGGNELNDVTIYSPEIISSSEIELRQDVEDNQSQTLDLEDTNSRDYGRNEVDAVQQMNVVVWKQAAALAARQFAIERSAMGGEKTADSQVDAALVDGFVEMTTDLLRVFISSECLNVLDRRRLADVCHLVSDLFGE